MLNNGAVVTKLVYFDYCACIVLLMILISTVLRKMTRGRLNRYFLELIITALIAAIADIFAITHDNALYSGTLIRNIEHSVYLVMHSFTTPIFAVYTTELTDTRHIVVKHRPLIIMTSLPYLVLLTAFALNPFNDKMFYFDEQYRYVRGDWFPLMYISMAFYVVYIIFFLVKYKKSISISRWLSLVTLLIFLLAAVGVQYFKPDTPVEMFANAIGLLFISVMVQRPEEVIDVESGAKSRNAFAADMQRSFSNGKQFDIIVLKISNLHSYGDILSYEERLFLLKETRTRLENLKLQNEFFSQIYYLRGGIFSVVVDAQYMDKSDELAQQIYDSTTLPITVNDMQINLVGTVCLIRCPDDISDSGSLSAFMTHSVTAEKGGILKAKDLLGSQSYDMLVDMETIINRALTDGGFEVYYQPIYSTVDDKFSSAEALLRLKDPKYGFVPPDMFIPVAEKNGTIHKIGMFVLESVCRFIASDKFKELGIDYIEVNLSVVQCMNATLADDIMKMMDKYGVSPSQINLEITESFASHFQNTMASNIKRLLDVGITFSLDDFGTGYSNIQSIASLPLVITKLDKSFVDMDMESTDKMTVVVERSIDMIKALEMKIVVEGVETKEMLKRFSDLGCEYIQGYYFSKPLPQDKFESFVLEHKDKTEA